MRIYFTNTLNDQPICKCPHNMTDDNGNIKFVGDACKTCPYCTHYEIKHSLVPKSIRYEFENVDDWYVQSFSYGMNQYIRKDIGFITCKHGIWKKESLKMIFSRLWYKIKSMVLVK